MNEQLESVLTPSEAAAITGYSREHITRDLAEDLIRYGYARNAVAPGNTRGVLLISRTWAEKMREVRERGGSSSDVWLELRPENAES
jgi:hypothetical protein